MLDFLRRLLIAGIVALCVSLLFLGGKQSKAEMLEVEELTMDWIWPTDGIITDTYGTRNGEHYGIDIAAGLGTPIHSVDNGVVTKSYYSSSYGHVVFIKHDNHLETVYAHLKKRNVQEGQAIGRGEVIGEMGSTGRSSGVHLHFEVHESEWTVDKKNALDPVFVLGKIKLGENVQAFSKNKDSVLHAMAKAQVSEHHTQTYIVQSGDNLSVIAEKTETTIEELKKKNHLKSDVIHPKQVLIIDHNK